MKPRIVPPLPALDAPADPKTEFFMTASHQLKTPLAILQWCIQSTLEDKALPEQTRSLLNRAEEQTTAMSHLLSDMLNVFRIVHGQKANERALVPVDTGLVLTAVLEQYHATAEQAGVHLIKGPIEQVPMVLADEMYLKQALINLVDNAIKYTARHGKVEVSLAVRAHHVCVEITDTGIGIADADAGRLFTEFFRAESAKQKAREGTGLGLVLVKHIIERFGGDVQFKSLLGKGSTFTLRLPLPSMEVHARNKKKA